MRWKIPMTTFDGKPWMLRLGDLDLNRVENHVSSTERQNVYTNVT
jgi:hypothetical protein